MLSKVTKTAHSCPHRQFLELLEDRSVLKLKDSTKLEEKLVAI